MTFGAEFVGRRVSVLLGLDDEGEPVRLVGVLVSIEAEGDFVIDTDDDGRRFCWPALEIEALDTDAGRPHHG